MWTSEDARKYLKEVLDRHGYQLNRLSLALPRSHSYLQQYIKDGTPQWLKQRDREKLCQLVPELNESLLKEPPPELSASTQQTGGDCNDQAQIDAQADGEFIDDPRILQLIAAYRRIRNQEDRAFAIRMVDKLAAASAAIVA